MLINSNAPVLIENQTSQNVSMHTSIDENVYHFVSDLLTYF